MFFEKYIKVKLKRLEAYNYFFFYLNKKNILENFWILLK